MTSNAIDPLAFLLSAIGVYGVTAYTVASRTHDVGIRMALGATGSRILRETLVRGLRPVFFGMIVGVILSLATTRVLSSFLFEVEPTDPHVYAVVALLLCSTAAVAGYVPARRAARSDPLTALKVNP